MWPWKGEANRAPARVLHSVVLPHCLCLNLQTLSLTLWSMKGSLTEKERGVTWWGVGMFEDSKCYLSTHFLKGPSLLLQDFSGVTNLTPYLFHPFSSSSDKIIIITTTHGYHSINSISAMRYKGFIFELQSTSILKPHHWKTRSSHMVDASLLGVISTKELITKHHHQGTLE